MQTVNVTGLGPAAMMVGEMCRHPPAAPAYGGPYSGRAAMVHSNFPSPKPTAEQVRNNPYMQYVLLVWGRTTPALNTSFSFGVVSPAAI